jgi:single-strand DNA-binding protein
MSDLAVAVIVGRLTRDAELKYTNSGQSVCHFSVATSSRRKKGDQWVDEASFWDVDLWGKQGESINQYLTKGKLVAVEGSMRQDKWEQDGQTRTKTLISANTVQLLGSSGSQGPGGSAFERPQSRVQGSPSGAPQGGGYGAGQARQDGGGSSAAPGNANGGAVGGDEFTDDIPF